MYIYPSVDVHYFPSTLCPTLVDSLYYFPLGTSLFVLKERDTKIMPFIMATMLAPLVHALYSHQDFVTRHSMTL